VKPRSSIPSKLTMHVSRSRLARSCARARAPSIAVLLGVREEHPHAGVGREGVQRGEDGTTPAALSTAPAERLVTRFAASNRMPAMPARAGKEVEQAWVERTEQRRAPRG